MFPHEIDLIRDAGQALKSTRPSMALKLLALALRGRPNGSKIKEAFNSLKEKENIKTFFVIGNCQAESISRLLDKQQRVVSLGFIAVHRYSFSDDIYRYMEQADYIVTQTISDSFNGINTKQLQSLFGNKLIRIPNLHFEGFHPDWCYLPKINGKRLQSPIGDYHNALIVRSFLNNDSVEKAIENLTDKNLYKQLFSGHASVSLSELIAREKDLDVCMSDVVKDKFEQGVVCFHSFNHPKKEMIEALVGKILKLKSIEFTNQQFEKEILDAVQLRSNILFNWNGAVRQTIKNGKEIKDKEFVERCFSIYADNPDFVYAFREKNKL